ncbi:MAG TPA: cupin domain-containing protein [Oleiagrimonas sp.]|nr:cupin domain-containing protein [Oleiagrimonas sp.]
MLDIDLTHIDSVPVVRIGPGCTRRDLPPFNGSRAWIVDIEAGCRWPFMDQHDEKGELVLVLSGDLIEGDRTFGPGSYLLYGPHSSHASSTRHGVRLFGLNAI